MPDISFSQNIRAENREEKEEKGAEGRDGESYGIEFSISQSRAL